jgi:hypothetical protein
MPFSPTPVVPITRLQVFRRFTTALAIITRPTVIRRYTATPVVRIAQPQGLQALFYNTTGIANNAVGSTALDSYTSGSYNTALGDAAGYNATIGDHNVYIGAGMYGVA